MTELTAEQKNQMRAIQESLSFRSPPIRRRKGETFHKLKCRVEYFSSEMVRELRYYYIAPLKEKDMRLTYRIVPHAIEAPMWRKNEDGEMSPVPISPEWFSIGSAEITMSVSASVGNDTLTAEELIQEIIKVWKGKAKTLDFEDGQSITPMRHIAYQTLQKEEDYTGERNYDI